VLFELLHDHALPPEGGEEWGLFNNEEDESNKLNINYWRISAMNAHADPFLILVVLRIVVSTPRCQEVKGSVL
jgi:hypothetical protein